MLSAIPPFSVHSLNHLGSASVATTAGGAVASSQEYDAWGKVRAGGITQTSINYTGQRLDATGLLYYHARMYDPVLGRFVSADTIVPNPVNPQELNRYSYVLNNPLRYTDSTGHCAEAVSCIAEAAGVGFTVGGPAGAAAAALGTAGYVFLFTSLAQHSPPVTGETSVGGSGEFAGLEADATTPDTVPDAPDAGPDTGAEEDKLYSRGSGYRKQAYKDAEAAAPRNEDGEMICPTCGEVIPEKVTVDTKKGPVERRGYDMDHYPDTWAERKKKMQEAEVPPTRKQVLDEYNRDLRVQCPPCNQGHQYEGKPGAYGGPQ